jgi:hypothetical protein
MKWTVILCSCLFYFSLGKELADEMVVQTGRFYRSDWTLAGRSLLECAAQCLRDKCCTSVSFVKEECFSHSINVIETKLEHSPSSVYMYRSNLTGKGFQNAYIHMYILVVSFACMEKGGGGV